MPKFNTKAIPYYLVLPLLYLVSILPFRFLYFLSDYLLYPIIYQLIGYRKGVVEQNLFNAFPNKSAMERLSIEKRFYHYLCDLFLESIKGFTLSKKELLKRYEFEMDYSLTDKWNKENKNFIITLGHFGNYEWMALCLDLKFKHLGTAPYHEMSNSYFDQQFFKMRTKFGTIMYPTYETYKLVRKGFGKPFLVALANDQSAPPLKAYWTKFLNQDTSFFFGTEKMAKQFDMPVLFAEIVRIKRGYYNAVFKLITENPNAEPSGFIMEKHARLLEKQIENQPEFWLWSHKRWKHKKPTSNEV